MLRVPLVRQSNPYSCGAAALEAVLRYMKAPLLPQWLLQSVLRTSPEWGTEPSALVAYARSVGLAARWRTGVTLADLDRALNRGQPVIVDLQAWDDGGRRDYGKIWESGHYVVLVGHDRGWWFFMDPAIDGHYGFLTQRDFLSRWHDVDDRPGRLRRFVHGAVFFG